MAYLVNRIAGGRVRVTFTLESSEQERFERKALTRLGQEVRVDGFRPGKVPPELVRERAGKEALQEELILQAVRELYPDVVDREKLQTIGRPQVEVVSVSPFSFHLTAAELPRIELGAWQKVAVERKPVAVTVEQVEKVLGEVREGRATEQEVERSAKAGDRVELDFEITQAGVPLEGGSHKAYSAILGKGQFVPGFEAGVVGVVPKETKEFDFTFPKDYKRELAGKAAKAKVTLHKVWERTLPEVTDEFARTLGRFSSADDLRSKLKQNLEDESKEREEQRVERAMLEALVAAAKFGEIPDVLLESELDKMLHEFKHGIEHGGVEWAQYLASIKKDEAALRTELKPGANQRVKVALVIREFAQAEKLEADDEAVEAELAETLARYPGNPEVAQQVQGDGYRDYVRSVLTNRNVISWLKEKLVK